MFKIPTHISDVIHTVVPKSHNDSALRSCYQSSLDLAAEFEIRTLAFCSIPAGYPLQAATKITLEEVRKWLEVENNRSKMDRIIFVLSTEKEMKLHEDLMPHYFPTLQHMADFTEKDTQAHQKQEEEFRKKMEEKAKHEVAQAPVLILNLSGKTTPRRRA